MNPFCFVVILVLFQGGYSVSSVKNSPCYHSCACPDSITLEVSCMCPYDCRINTPQLNQLQMVEESHNTSLHKPEPRHLISWAAQLCGVAVMIVLQLATME